MITGQASASLITDTIILNSTSLEDNNDFNGSAIVNNPGVEFTFDRNPQTNPTFPLSPVIFRWTVDFSGLEGTTVTMKSEVLATNTFNGFRRSGFLRRRAPPR